MRMRLPFCLSCKHYNENERTCKAYPGSIPANLFWGVNYHLRPRKGQEGEYVYQPIKNSELELDVYRYVLNERTIIELKRKINDESQMIFNKINAIASQEFEGFDFYIKNTHYRTIRHEEQKMLLFKKFNGDNEFVSIGINPDLYHLLNKILLHYSSVEDADYLVYTFKKHSNEGFFDCYKSSGPSYSEYKRVISEYNRAKYRLENIERRKQGYELLTGRELEVFIEGKIDKEELGIEKNRRVLLSLFRQNKYIVELSELEELIKLKFY